MEHVNFWIVIGASLLSGATPGPASLTIAGTSMAQGRRIGLALAMGVTCGAITWAILAALGFGAILAANQTLVEIVRLCGAAYLAWLGFAAARSAMANKQLSPTNIGSASLSVAWVKGFLIHLTNPKAVIFWGSIFAIGTTPGANSTSIAWIIGTCISINILLVTFYALFFSSGPLTNAYLKTRRWIEAVFAAFFGGAALYLFANRID